MASSDVDIMDTDNVRVRPKGVDEQSASLSSNTGTGHGNEHGAPEVLSTESLNPDYEREGQASQEDQEATAGRTFVEKLRTKRGKWFAFVKTREFWIVLILGQALSLCETSTNTFTELLSMSGANIPAFQSLFNYALLNLIYSSITIYSYGFKKWLKLLYRDGWRYFILAFLDVEGNYFTVLAYGYTTILSAQLINFWAIVVVVIISLTLLKVRYHLTQYIGILICVGGMGILLASDHITGSNGGYARNQLKGDLFALAGATFYGFSNCYEEFMVSKRPLYEVVGQLAFWGMLINGVQTSIFDRNTIKHTAWSPAIAGYLVGYTLILSLFYTLAPILFRVSSAAFLNISLLTANFWGVIIGIQRFHLHVHWMYPIAFVLIIFGLTAYYMTESFLGESKKPWLGEGQQKGVSGIGTARQRLEGGGFFTKARAEFARPAEETLDGTAGPGVV